MHFESPFCKGHITTIVRVHTAVVMQSGCICCWVHVGWSTTSASKLLQAAVRLHSHPKANEISPIEREVSQPNTDATDLLPAAAAALAHVAEQALAATDLAKTGDGRSQSANQASRLGLTLSLLVYIGGLGSAALQDDSEMASAAAEEAATGHFAAGSQQQASATADSVAAKKQQDSAMQDPATVELGDGKRLQAETGSLQHSPQSICLQVGLPCSNECDNICSVMYV